MEKCPLALLIVIGLLIVIANAVTRPIQEFTSIVSGTTEGINDKNILPKIVTLEDQLENSNLYSKDETGKLASAFKIMMTQLRKALQMIAQEKRGVLLYMRQKGRGIGLENKIKAYGLQDKGLDTVEANEALGFSPDLRDYGIGAQILVNLGLSNIRLLTNNPRKIVGLEGYGIKIVERLALKVKENKKNKHYLQTKKKKLGHLI